MARIVRQTHHLREKRSFFVRLCLRLSLLFFVGRSVYSIDRIDQLERRSCSSRMFEKHLTPGQIFAGKDWITILYAVAQPGAEEDFATHQTPEQNRQTDRQVGATRASRSLMAL